MKIKGKKSTWVLLALAFGFILVTFLLNGLSSCVNPGMPTNGRANFHEITITIPDSFQRDAMQSYEDFWIFERDNYKQMILMSRRSITGDKEALLDNYIADIKKQGGDTKSESFLQMEAFFATYTKDGVFCQEIVFDYGGSFYAVAMRGVTQEEFQSLLNTVGISAAK